MEAGHYGRKYEYPFLSFIDKVMNAQFVFIFSLGRLISDEIIFNPSMIHERPP